MNGLRSTILTRFDELEALSADWEQLLAASPRAEIFETLPWARASWRTRERGGPVQAVVVRDGGEVAGLLPLTPRRSTLRFLAGPGADYADLLAPAGRAVPVLASALEALLAAPRVPWVSCRFRNVPGDGNLSAAWPGLPPTLHGRWVRRQATPCPALILGADRVAQLEALAGKESLRRHEAKLGRRGEVTFRHLEDRAAVRAALPDFFLQHERRRVLAGVPSQFRDPAERAFYEALVDELDPARELRFAILELDGRPVAYHFGFEYAKKFTWYKPAFDVNLWDEGPGEVLLRHLLLYCRGAAVRELDFTVGGEAFKYRFSNLVRDNWEFSFERSPARARAARLVLGARAGAARRWPGAWGRVRSARRGLAARVKRIGAEPAAALAALASHAAGLALRRDEVIAFVWRGAVPPLPVPAEPLELRAGSLADAADVAIAFPGDFGRGWLETARRRLKSGDRLHLAYLGGRLAHLAWVGRRVALDLTYEVGEGGHVALERPSSVIFGCWTPAGFRGRGIYTQVLRQLAESAAASGEPVYVYALAANRASCRGIERAGFTPWRRLGRLRIAGVFERRWTR